jgi:CRP-like cAMP-binding protein
MGAADLVREFQQGDVLFREGDAGETVYVIQTGAVQLRKRIDGVDTVVAELSDGDFLGEVGVVCNGAHTTTAVAMTATRCLVVDGASLEAMVTESQELSVRFIKGLAQRLAASHQLLATIGSRDARTRIGMALVRHAEGSQERSSDGVWLRKRLVDVGREVAVSDLELAEVSKDLVRLKLIRVKRDGILVLDVARMYEYVQSGAT